MSPCNSPEQVPITLGKFLRSLATDTKLTIEDVGCAHAQQVIWQLFNAVEKGFPASGDTDTAFLNGK